MTAMPISSRPILRHAGFTRIETHRLAEWVEDVSDPMTAVVGRAPAV